MADWELEPRDHDKVTDKSTQVLAPFGNGQPNNVMFVWEFYEAPEFVREHSTHGGDEDGIIWIPSGVNQPYWLERLWMTFGPGQDFIQFKDGLLIIWAHA
jgi:hypothetical protein